LIKAPSVPRIRTTGDVPAFAMADTMSCISPSSMLPLWNNQQKVSALGDGPALTMFSVYDDSL
jgi:hypothetical protein